MGAAEDALSLISQGPRDDESHRIAKKVREVAFYGVSKRGPKDRDRWYRVWEGILRWQAFDDFECYMEFLELNRPPEERFWIPRRKCLKKVADALQDLSDGKLDELILNLPPRVGKSTIVAYWLSWDSGRNPEKSHLYTSFSSPVTKAFYTGLLEVMKDPITYRYGEVFPNSPVVSTDANDETINLGRKKRYASITCRSIDGTLNGACDASGAMVGDDLCSGIEEAKNPLRLENLNGKVNNDWLSRRKQGCPIVWMGTRWSLGDPMGVRERLLREDKKFASVRWKKIAIPALDRHDQSNFSMPYGVGFSRADYQRVRAQFERQDDVASWLAMYQQSPIERHGAVFDQSELRTFSGKVPKGRVFMAVDPAFGGGDFTASPICVDDGSDVYVPAVVFSDKEKDVTLPMLAKAVAQWHVETVQFEASKMLQSYVDEFRDLLRRNGIRTTVITKPADTRQSKDERIVGKAPDIRQHFVFLDRDQRGRDYERFMEQVCAFTSQAKVRHDDAPDSLAMAAGMVYHWEDNKAFAFRRPF